MKNEKAKRTFQTKITKKEITQQSHPFEAEAKQQQKSHIDLNSPVCSFLRSLTHVLLCAPVDI